MGTRGSRGDREVPPNGTNTAGALLPFGYWKKSVFFPLMRK